MKSVIFAALASAALSIAPAATAQKPTAAPVKPAPQAAKAKAAPLFCVITGEDIASVKEAAGKAVYKGKTVYFCCPGCIGRFNKASDAQKAAFVKANELRVKKAMAGKAAPVATEPMKHGEGAMHHGAAKTEAGTAGLTCAVTGESIASIADAAGGKSDYNGKTYYFCCPGCKTKFDADPAKYAAK